jgi:hypothetical protein
MADGRAGLAAQKAHAEMLDRYRHPAARSLPEPDMAVDLHGYMEEAGTLLRAIGGVLLRARESQSRAGMYLQLGNPGRTELVISDAEYQVNLAADVLFTAAPKVRGIDELIRQALDGQSGSGRR